MTSPEQIVRTLAAADPTTFDDDGRWTRCGLCAGQGRIADGCDPSVHAPDCPWRLAVEWCAAQIVEDPEGRTGDYFRHATHPRTSWRLRGREAGGDQRYVLEREDGDATVWLFTVAAIITLSLITGPWPPLLLALALVWLAAIITLYVAGLIMQALEYGREQRIMRAARLAELERWHEREMEAER